MDKTPVINQPLSQFTSKDQRFLFFYKSPNAKHVYAVNNNDNSLQL